MTTATARRILRLPAVIEKSGLGRDSIYRLAREGRFPKPIKLSKRASGWLEHEVDEFLAKRAAERDGHATP
jgi:prophage regulatory protein